MDNATYQRLLNAKADRAEFDNQALSSARTLERQRQQQIERDRLESEERARSFQRSRLVGQFIQSGDPQPIAYKKAFDLIPSSDPKIMLEVSEAAKGALHPKEFVPISMGGETYNSNAITGQVGSPYKVNAPTQTYTPGVFNGRPGQSNNVTGRVIYDPATPDTSKIDASGRALIARAVEDANSEDRIITNTPANVLRQYQDVVNPPASPAAMANQLAVEHPDWTREKIIQEVKTRLKK